MVFSFSFARLYCALPSLLLDGNLEGGHGLAGGVGEVTGLDNADDLTVLGLELIVVIAVAIDDIIAVGRELKRGAYDEGEQLAALKLDVSHTEAVSYLLGRGDRGAP